MSKSTTIAKPFGRPTKYLPKYCKTAYRMALVGCKDSDIAAGLDISRETLYQWFKEHPDFSDSVKNGRKDADGYVAHSLFHRAKGYSHKSEKIFCNKDGEVTKVATVEHYPPDTVACIFWLKNRQPELWKDRIEGQIDINNRIEISREELVRALIDDPLQEAKAKLLNSPEVIDVTPEVEGQSTDGPKGDNPVTDK